MNKTALSANLIVALGLLAGCSKPASQDAAEQPRNVEAAPAPMTAAPATPPPVAVDSRSQVTTDHLDMYVADGRVQTWEGVGTRSGDKLTSSATDGFLMFGPKVPFAAGEYKVIVHGEGLAIAPENSITFDVTSNAGEQIHAKQTLDASASVQTGQPLAEFTFSLPEAVTDLEVRAFVTSGSQVTLTRFEVTRVP